MSKFSVGQTLEVQDETLRFWKSKVGRDFMAGWLRSRKEGGWGDLDLPSYEHLRAEIDGLRAADTYFISTDMAALAMHAAQSMPEHRVEAWHLPSNCGFALLETPLTFRDVREEMVTFAAMMWHKLLIKVEGREDYTADEAVMISIYSDLQDDRDETLHRYTSVGFPCRMVLLGKVYFSLLRSTLVPEQIAERHGIPVDLAREGVLHAEKFPLALWALIEQKLGRTTIERSDRPARRRLERAGSTLAGRDIRYVTLRRPEAPRHIVEGTAAHVEWSHRWMVQGHWRNVWHASQKKHHLQWIAPFVKGPDDKPLVLKQTVYKLVR